MSQEFTIVVPAGKTRERIDLFLSHHVENATRSKVQRAIRNGMVLVNGRPVRPSYLVSPGDIIQVTLPRSAPQDAIAENIPLDILYEDDHLLVVNKPAGMVTHPAFGNRSGTLVNALLHHFSGLLAVGDPSRPGIVHRLDKDTSGLLVVAKSDMAHAHLARQFARRTVEREYHAIVWGSFRDRSGTVDAALGRSKSDRKKIAVVQGGKTAVTEYTVLRQFPYLSLLALRLQTGRTHQIRVHLAHVHHPVFGDPTYQGRRISWGPRTPRQRSEVQSLLEIIHRQALHARTIGFLHPETGKSVRFESPLPGDMRRVLEVLNESEDT